jgi:hypothetical protein
MTTKKRASKAPKKLTTKQVLSVATSAKNAPKERIKALAQNPLVVVESDENLQAVLAILLNQQEPVQVRLAAMDTFATAAFSAVVFAPYRTDYIGALREVAQDPNPQIRESALGLLAGEKDGFAQKLLLEGLKEPKKALVPPEKALQLLSYDVHAEAYDAAREIVNNPPNEVARREALRLLAADAKSAPIFEKLLRDKKELREIRQISASALRAVSPKKFQQQAREILLDKSDFDDIKATSLTALEQFGDEETVAKDEELLKSVTRLSGQAKSAKYKKSAKQFLTKFKR